MAISPATGSLSTGRGRLTLILLLLWSTLLWRGFPFPYVDDSYFIGPALSLADGEGMVNSLLGESHPYYMYLPVYPCLLGSWLRFWGASAAAISCYYALAGWITTWCIVRSFKLAGKERLGWIAVVALVVYFACVGLRPDVTSFLFLALSLRAGVAIRPVWRWLSPFLALLAVATLPASLAIAAPWLAYLLLTDRRMWLPSVIGAILVAVIVSAMVQGQVRELLAGLTANAAGSRGIQTGWLRGNWDKPQGLVKYFFPLVAGIWAVAGAVWRRGFRQMDFLFLLALLLGFYAATSSYSGQWILSIVTVIDIIWYLEISRLRCPWKPVLIGCTALLVIGAELRHLLQGVSTEKPANDAVLLAKVDALHPSLLVVDPWSLRYVFNDHLRPGMLFIQAKAQAAPGAGAPPRPKKEADECWVISAESTAFYQLEEKGLPHPRPMTIGSLPLGQWITNAGELAILPPTVGARPAKRETP